MYPQAGAIIQVTFAGKDGDKALGVWRRPYGSQADRSRDVPIRNTKGSVTSVR
jgi:hypothetical protein